MPRIILVRHGQDTDNVAGLLNGRRDTELTELGREQAREVAAKLLDYNIQIIYSSPLKRTYETAQIIAAKLGLADIIKDDRLMERDFGILTGTPIIDIPAKAPHVFPAAGINYFWGTPGTEDFPTLLKRGQSVLGDIKAKYPTQNILIVIHGDIGKMIQAANNNWTWEQGLQAPYIKNTDLVELKK